LGTSPYSRLLYYSKQPDKNQGLAILLFCKLHDFSCFLQNSSVVFPPVRNEASGAILNSLLCIDKISAAVFTQRIQRTVAEQAAKALLLPAGVAWKVFTFPVLKKIIVRHTLPPWV